MPPLSQLAVSGVVTVCTRPGKQQENSRIHSYLRYQALTQMGSTWGLLGDHLGKAAGKWVNSFFLPETSGSDTNEFVFHLQSFKAS